jgi:predicted nucleic acid-binding protein
VNIVDSSAWIEFLADGANASEFAVPIDDGENLLVPSLTLYEVFKRVVQLKGESAALEAVGVMLRGRVVEVSASIALEAARVSIAEKLAMADSVILATARLEGAVLWTQDADFDGLEGVEYRATRQA